MLGLPVGLAIVVGFIRSGKMTAGTSSMVVQVTSEGCDVVAAEELDELHGLEGGFSDPDVVVQKLDKGLSVISFSLTDDDELNLRNVLVSADTAIVVG